MKLALVSALLLASWLHSAAVLAEPGASLVVLVADEPGDEVSAQLERDLRSWGLSVMVLSATPENSSSAVALERTARGLGGIAAVRVLGGARGSELWVLEPATRRTVTRSLARPAGSSAEANEVALGTLELLRASLMELHHTEARVAPTPGPSAATPAAPQRAPATHGFSLSGGLGADLGLRSVGPSLTTLWAAGLGIAGCFGARGFASLPVLAERTEVPEGRVEVAPTLLGIGVTCSLSRSGAWLSPRVSLGFAGARVETRGTADDPRSSNSASAWFGGGYGLLGLALRITRDVRLNLDATGVLLATPAVIVVSRREIGTWGAPGGVLSLGVEVLASR